MKWYCVKDKKPAKEGKILVYINDEFFVAKVEKERFEPAPIISKDDNKIIYWISPYPSCTGWLMPSHFKDPEYWCYLTDPTTQEDASNGSKL